MPFSLCVHLLCVARINEPALILLIASFTTWIHKTEALCKGTNTTDTAERWHSTRPPLRSAKPWWTWHRIQVLVQKRKYESLDDRSVWLRRCSFTGERASHWVSQHNELLPGPMGEFRHRSLLRCEGVTAINFLLPLHVWVLPQHGKCYEQTLHFNDC